jgi:pimeloyl-ACP methyl ester carboxylesterase
MLQFQPPGFGQKSVETSLGTMTYYLPVAEPWLTSDEGDRPTLIFLHNFGGGASAYEWSKVYPAFATQYRVLAPDLLGWGASAHPQRDYQITDYLTTLAEFIEQVTSTPVIVVAASLTGAIVIRLAIQKPQLFQSLFLSCPAGFADFGQDAGRRLPLQLIGTPGLNQFIYNLGATNEPAVRNFLTNFLFAQPDRISDETVAAYLASAQQPNAEYAALAFLKGNLYFDLARYIEQLTVPTVFVWGEAAQFTPVELGRRLAKLNPKFIQGFETIAHAGVLPHLEQPEVFIGVMQKILLTQ